MAPWALVPLLGRDFTHVIHARSLPTQAMAMSSLHSQDRGLRCLLGSLRNASSRSPSVAVTFYTKETPLYLAHNLKCPAGGTMEGGITHLIAELNSYTLRVSI